MIDNAALRPEMNEMDSEEESTIVLETREESNLDNEEIRGQNQAKNQFSLLAILLHIGLVLFLAYVVSVISYKGGFIKGEQHEQREKYKSLRLEFMKDEVAVLCAQSKFKEASRHLDNLKSPREYVVLSASLELRIAECFTQQGRKKKAEEVINATRHVLMPSLPNEVCLSGKTLIDDKSYMRAIFLLRIASDMYRSNMSSPNVTVDVITKCVGRIFNATVTMLELGPKPKALAITYGLQYMVKMLDDLRDVENANPARKSRQIAWCMRSIGRVYNWTEEYQKSIDFYKNGINILEQKFGLKNCSKYKIYGLLLNNIGESYNQLAEYDREDCSTSMELDKIDIHKKAEIFFVKAISAFQNAIDCKNDARKNRYLKQVETNLYNTRKLVKDNMLGNIKFYKQEQDMKQKQFT